MREAGESSIALVDEGLEILDDEECWRLLRTGVVGRVGVSIAALPAIFPVNYAVVDETIVFWTSPGTKLDVAIRGAVVAFQVDELDRTTRTGWSVQVVGTAREVVDPSLFVELLGDGRGPWVRGVRSHVVQISSELLTGRRIVESSAARAGV